MGGVVDLCRPAAHGDRDINVPSGATLISPRQGGGLMGRGAGRREVRHKVRASFRHARSRCTTSPSIGHDVGLFIGLESTVQPPPLRHYNCNSFANCMCDASHARMNFETRRVFMRLRPAADQESQRGPSPGSSQQTVFPGNEAARSLVGSARLVSVPRPLRRGACRKFVPNTAPLAELDHFDHHEQRPAVCCKEMAISAILCERRGGSDLMSVKTNMHVLVHVDGAAA